MCQTVIHQAFLTISWRCSVSTNEAWLSGEFLTRTRTRRCSILGRAGRHEYVRPAPDRKFPKLRKVHSVRQEMDAETWHRPKVSFYASKLVTQDAHACYV
jgi:hypothetical protein